MKTKDKLTPELVAYVRREVTRRGIKQDEFGPDCLGRILKAAITHFDRVCSRVRRDQRCKDALCRQVYNALN